LFASFTRFFVYSNLFIACCAVLMLNQTFSFLLNAKTDIYLTGFVFFSTICSYSFHWYLTSHSVLPSSRVDWLRRHRRIHFILFWAGLTGSAVFFYYLLPYWQWLLVAAVATFLYSAPKIPHKYFRALRKVALGKTIFLAFVWMYVTSILPVLVSEKEWTTAFSLYAVSRFFLIYAICILFDYRDRADDKEAGIRSLITYFDEKGIAVIFISSILIFFVSTLWLLDYGYGLLAVCILLIPGIITALLYNYARKHFSDLFYYFVLDGLMALSALLMLIPGI
jgi:4-hydroxybenzoate polyprenyltransferase